MSAEAQEGRASLDTAEFRRVIGHFATGVAVVTSAAPKGPPCGLTASAVASVSLEPHLVLVCVELTSDTHRAIERSSSFAINVLAEDGEAMARRFATYPSEEKFEGVAYRKELTGAPILEVSLAWVDCELRNSYDGGDHTIYVGEVRAGDARDGPPLLHFRGGYGRLSL